MADIPESTNSIWRDDWCSKLNLEDIPICSGIPKGEKAEKVSISLWARIKRMAEVLKDNSSRFRTVSDIYRAAMFIGLHILYYMNTEGVRAEGDAFFKYFLEVRKKLLCNDIMDMFVELVNDILATHDRQNVDSEEVQGLLKVAVDVVPPEFRKIAQAKMDRLVTAKRLGTPVNTLYENVTTRQQ